MNHAEHPTPDLEPLRHLPLEVGLDQVQHMVNGFPLAMGAMAWLIHTLKFNLNTIVMSTLGTFIAGSALVLSLGQAGHSAALPATPLPAEAVARQSPASAPVPQTVAPVPSSTKEGAVRTTPKAAPTPPSAPPPSAGSGRIVVVAPAPESPTAAGPVPGMPKTLVQSPGAPPTAPVPLPAHAPQNKGKVTSAMGERRYDLRGFTGIRMTTSVDVQLSEGDFSVLAIGNEAALEKLSVRVDGDLLVVGRNEGKGGFKDDDLHVQVRMPKLQQITVSGSGDVHASAFGQTGDLLLELTGSGNIYLESVAQATTLTVQLVGSGDVKAASVNVAGTTKLSLTGSGDVEVTGSTNLLEADLLGSGDVKAGGLSTAQGGKLSLMGSGDVVLANTANFEVRAMGSGEVRTRGQGDD